jgi:hypothetical protein
MTRSGTARTVIVGWEGQPPLASKPLRVRLADDAKLDRLGLAGER